MTRRDYSQPPTREELAAFLKQSREAAGFTQYAAAQAVGTTVTSISRWETATHPIGAQELISFLLLYDALDPFLAFLTGERGA